MAELNAIRAVPTHRVTQNSRRLGIRMSLPLSCWSAFQRLPAYAHSSTIRDWPFRVVMEACTMIAVTPVQPPRKGYHQPVKGFGCEGGFLARDNLCASQPLATALIGKQEWEARGKKRMTPRPFF